MMQALIPAELLDAMNCGIVLIDGDERVILWNAWMAERSEIDSGRALGATLTSLFPQIAGSRLEMAVQAAVRSGLSTVLSHNLHPRPLPLFTASPRRGGGVLSSTPIEQSTVIRAVRQADGARRCLIQIYDVTAAVLRERRMLANEQQLRAAQEELSRQAALDPLLGIANRRRFLEATEVERLRSQREGIRFSLAMIDVDHFKVINDTFGHSAGDEILHAVSTCIQNAVRGTDLLARYGGEEFVALLPHTDLAGAEIIMERIRHAVAGEKFAAGSRPIAVTVSAGVSEWHPSDPSIDHTLARADLGLYRAKQAGRNRVCTTPRSDPDA